MKRLLTLAVAAGLTVTAGCLSRGPTVLLFGRDYQPAFRLVAVHPDGFADFALLKANLDRRLEAQGAGAVLALGLPPPGPVGERPVPVRHAVPR
jgi:hypothetical protein